MNNIQFVSTVKFLCKTKGITITMLLETCSLRKSLIYDIEKRNAKPSVEVVEAIAGYLNCSIDYLLGRTDNPEVNRLKFDPPVPDPAQPTNVRLINYYYRLASAGSGQIVFDSPPTKRIEIPDTPKNSHIDYAVEVNGTSMEPSYHDGDILLVEMTDSVEIGEIGIFLVNGECFVKEYQATELRSLNPKAANIPLDETARCMGKVIDVLDKSNFFSS